MYSSKAQREIKHKLKIFKDAEISKNITITCRHYGIYRDNFYRWKHQYLALGDQGLINSKPCPQNPKIRVKPEIEEKNSLSQKTLSFWTAENRLTRF